MDQKRSGFEQKLGDSRYLFEGQDLDSVAIDDHPATASRAMSDLLGAGAEDALDRHAYQSHASAEPHPKGCTGRLLTQPLKGMAAWFALWPLWKRRGTTPHQSTVSCIADPTHTAGTHRRPPSTPAITYRAALETELRRLEPRYALLCGCARSLAALAREADLLHAFCRHLVEVGGYRHAWVGYASEAPPRQLSTKAHVGPANDPLAAALIAGTDSQDRPDPSRTAIQTGRPVILRHMEADLAIAPRWRSVEARRSQSMIALPLAVDGRSLGHLSVISAEADAFEADEVALLTELATDLAFGIEAARTRAASAQQVRCLREEVEQTERRRLAATLHDGVLQSLQAINLGMKGLGARVAAGQPLPVDILDQLITEVGDAMGELRAISQELRPRFLEHLTLHEAIRFQCSELAERAETPIRCLIDLVPYLLEDRVKVQCFLAFREALGNALKHASATRIDVTLTPDAPGFLTLCIADNGRGFDLPRTLSRPVGLGLSMIAERAESVGGRTEIRSKPGAGTQVRIMVPVSGAIRRHP